MLDRTVHPVVYMLQDWLIALTDAVNNAAADGNKKLSECQIADTVTHYAS